MPAGPARFLGAGLNRARGQRLARGSGFWRAGRTLSTDLRSEGPGRVPPGTPRNPTTGLRPGVVTPGFRSSTPRAQRDGPRQYPRSDPSGQPQPGDGQPGASSYAKAARVPADARGSRDGSRSAPRTPSWQPPGRMTSHTATTRGISRCPLTKQGPASIILAGCQTALTQLRRSDRGSRSPRRSRACGLAL